MMNPLNVAELFQRSFEINKERIALTINGNNVSYSELWSISDRILMLIRKRFLDPEGSTVAIVGIKHQNTYATMLACLRAGVPYTVVDPASPEKRLKKILSTANAEFVLYPLSEPAAEPWLSLPRVVTLSDEALEPDSHQTQVHGLRNGTDFDGSTIAYIMFTSGSTGDPKGVAITHASLLSFLNWSINRFNVGSEDTLLGINPIFFDNSVFDFYTALAAGATLAPVESENFPNPAQLASAIETANPTVWLSVPSLFNYLIITRALNPQNLGRLRAIIFGGEPYPTPQLTKLFELFSESAKLYNVYGPTETTCICSCLEVTREVLTENPKLVPLGVLNPNFDFQIIDEKGDSAEEGELVLIGPNVGAGYFNDWARTEERFGRLGSSEKFGKPFYRTGDLVRLSQGQLHFVGRTDFQIKNMGYRIELGEIEQSLLTQASVDEAAVIFKKSPHGGKIVGFVSTNTPIDPTALLGELRSSLPKYMVPSKIEVLDRIPKNPAGKVDRQALATLDLSPPSSYDTNPN